MEIIDISPLISEKLAVFPEDTPFQEEFLMHTDLGHHISLSKVTTTLHLGAHTDAPNHYAANSPGIDERPLDFYLGKAQVIEVHLPRGERIRKVHLKNQKIEAKRVLFKTLSFPDPYQWNNDFNSLSQELVEFLAEQKVKLVGIDTPSIDPANDQILESHRSVHAHNMAILEGIVLNQTPPGIYELIALPLKIKGADASPVRAILRKWNSQPEAHLK